MIWSIGCPANNIATGINRHNLLAHPTDVIDPIPMANGIFPLTLVIPPIDQADLPVHTAIHCRGRTHCHNCTDMLVQIVVQSVGVVPQINEGKVFLVCHCDVVAVQRR